MLSGFLCVTAFSPDSQKAQLDRKEARQAFELLNKIRRDPDKYYDEYGLSGKLKITTTALVWDEHLAEAAERKALDMAGRGYFAHVDPEGRGMNYYINKSGYTLIPAFLKNKAANNFESIAYGPKSGEELIRTLILDEGVPSMGHRNHLLGIGAWDSSLMDIGIGFAFIKKNGYQQTYISVIIAKHSW